MGSQERPTGSQEASGMTGVEGVSDGDTGLVGLDAELLQYIRNTA